MNNYSIRKHSQTGQTLIEKRHVVTEHKEDRTKSKPESAKKLVSQKSKFSFNVFGGE